MAERAFAEIKNDTITRFLSKLKKKFKGASTSTPKYAKTIAPIVFKDIITHFSDQKGPKGKWKKWSDVYSDHMSKIGKGGNKILQDTGRLRQSFVPKNVRKVKSGLVWFNPAQTTDGFPYAFAHDNDGARKTLPRRQFMWLSKKALKEIGKITVKGFLK